MKIKRTDKPKSVRDCVVTMEDGSTRYAYCIGGEWNLYPNKYPAESYISCNIFETTIVEDDQIIDWRYSEDSDYAEESEGTDV